MSNESKAIRLASEAHNGDLWGNKPYLLHLSLVAARVREVVAEDTNINVNVENAVNAAWLHDTIEDHPEYDERVLENFPELIDSLRLLARDSSVSYSDYVQSVIDSGDRLALLVKICDMYVNMSNNPPDGLMKRYTKSYTRLLEAWTNGENNVEL